MGVGRGVELIFAGVQKSYLGERGQTVALDNLDLEITPGSSVAIIGPSGCGKSTALRMAAGLIHPTKGSVVVGGKDVESPRIATSLMLQDGGLLPWKTVQANTGLGLQIRGLSRPERKALVERALGRVGLAEFSQYYPAELSGGMKQRVAFARALALDSDLLLMDEPLSALDALMRESMQDLLAELWLEKGYTQVLVTHSIEEAAFLGQRIVVMAPRPGRVVEVVENPGAMKPDFRTSEEFFNLTSELRRVIAAKERKYE